jgi:hypothetical protein
VSSTVGVVWPWEKENTSIEAYRRRRWTRLIQRHFYSSEETLRPLQSVPRLSAGHPPFFLPPTNSSALTTSLVASCASSPLMLVPFMLQHSSGHFPPQSWRHVHLSPSHRSQVFNHEPSRHHTQSLQSKVETESCYQLVTHQFCFLRIPTRDLRATYRSLGRTDTSYMERSSLADIFSNNVLQVIWKCRARELTSNRTTR